MKKEELIIGFTIMFCFMLGGNITASAKSWYWIFAIIPLSFGMFLLRLFYNFDYSSQKGDKTHNLVVHTREQQTSKSLGSATTGVAPKGSLVRDKPRSVDSPQITEAFVGETPRDKSGIGGEKHLTAGTNSRKKEAGR